jgi:GT2 family glycosyltransferase
VILVNDGDLTPEDTEYIQKKFDCPVKFTSSDGPPGTSTARNTGVREATSPVVLILDDDVVIGPNYLEKLREVYISLDNRQLAGVGGFDSSLRNPSALERRYNQLFYLGYKHWQINTIGMQSWDPTIEKITRTEWLSGNNASYKRELLLDHPFPHWSGGREPLEDVAMGMQLKQQGYYCLIDPMLPVQHNQSEDDETSIDFGIKRGRNRIRIFREYGSRYHTPVFIWALFGDTLRQFLAPFSDSKWHVHLMTGIGMIIGIFAEIVTPIRD